MFQASVCLVIAALIGCEPATHPADTGHVRWYRLRLPGDEGDIEQASGLDCGRIGGDEGLWLVCDRNGGRSANRVFIIAGETLRRAKHGGKVVADRAYVIAPPSDGWDAFGVRYPLEREVLEGLRQRVEHGINDREGPRLDLEAVAIGASTTNPEEARLFVVAEEPFSTVLELALDGSADPPVARISGAYHYAERDDEYGTDRNDGLEGLAYGSKPGNFDWAEEGTRFHDGPPGPKLFFLAPRLGRARLTPGRVEIEEGVSRRLTAAVQAQRLGKMQTLNALTRDRKGRLLAVDRNGGWILRVDPDGGSAERWINLYDVAGVNLRDALASFPGERKMPYISIEGIAVDDDDAIWLVDDPAMPESFRASCLVRLTSP
jgi:hypothetical protein